MVTLAIVVSSVAVAAVQPFTPPPEDDAEVEDEALVDEEDDVLELVEPPEPLEVDEPEEADVPVPPPVPADPPLPPHAPITPALAAKASTAHVEIFMSAPFGSWIERGYWTMIAPSIPSVTPWNAQ
jgi:hypothetical protein